VSARLYINKGSLDLTELDDRTAGSAQVARSRPL
jgi:hypothetical protein